MDDREMDQPDNERQPKDRPFPWICPHCLRREVRPAVVAYTTEVLHEGRLYEVVMPTLTTPKCSHCGELLFDNRTDDQITAAFNELIATKKP